MMFVVSTMDKIKKKIIAILAMEKVADLFCLLYEKHLQVLEISDGEVFFGKDG